MIVTTQAAPTQLATLVQPIGGLLGQLLQLPPQPGEPEFPIYGASLGDVHQVLNPYSRLGEQAGGALHGAGGALDPDQARIKAMAEALERYASCVYDERQFLWATAAELGADALDLDTVPRSSATELAHPRCLALAPDKHAPLRWVRGVSLLDGRAVWIPAIMVYLKLAPMSRGERFHLPISTGCAAHTTIEQALLGGLCEVIERDAIALTWLQQLELPRIELDDVPGHLQDYLDRYARSSEGLETLFFDATTELGVPTVYSLQLSPRNQILAALVMCSTELDPAVALAKVLRESASSRTSMQQPHEIPASWDDFIDVFHGAVFMGHPERLPAFDFLRHSTRRRNLSDMPVLTTGDARRDLVNLLARLRQHEMEAFAVDLTTDEAARVGMKVVRTIIPRLQPLSFSYRARYQGHPRLYEAPRLMGYPVRAEAGLNPWPQPFA